LLLLPLLFLPDMGLSAGNADVGGGELSDFLVAPYLLAVYFAGNRRGFGSWRQARPLLLFFLGWALLSTLTINLRFGYSGYETMIFSGVKVGKLAVYGTAGVLTARALEQDLWARSLYPWALLAVCVIVSTTFLVLRGTEYVGRAATLLGPRMGYQSDNAMSVALVILYGWLVAYWASSSSSNAWNTALAVVSPLLMVGLFYTDGRGGWVAGVLALGYVAVRLGIRPSVAGAGLVGLLTVIVLYQSESGFRSQIDMTFDPTRLSYQSQFASSTGIDDGSRLEIWTHEAPQIIEAPILGVGLFHRGGGSHLFLSGSHNYWLQMFLETGLVGGLTLLVLLRRIWRYAGSLVCESANVSTAARAALIAAFVGGLSEAYFYGGKPLLALLFSLAPALSLPYVPAPAKENSRVALRTAQV